MGRSGAVRLCLPACGQGRGWWDHVTTGTGAGAEPEVGLETGQDSRQGGDGTRKVSGQGQNKGGAGPLPLSLLPFLVPGQVDRRVAANADACQV